MKLLKVKNFFEGWRLYLMYVLLIPSTFGLLDGLRKDVREHLDDVFFSHVDNVEAVVQHWPIIAGGFMSVLDRIDIDKQYYTTFEDGIPRKAEIYGTNDNPPLYFIFIEHEVLGWLWYSGYYNAKRDLWECYTFNEKPHTVLERRRQGPETVLYQR